MYLSVIDMKSKFTSGHYVLMQLSVEIYHTTDICYIRNQVANEIHVLV